MGSSGRLQLSVIAWVAVGAFLTLVWIILSQAYPTIMPGPPSALSFLYQNLDMALKDSVTTLGNTLAGFAISIISAILLSIMWLKGGIAALFVERLNVVIQSVSALVWAIVFLLIFGYTSRLSSVGVAAATAFPIILSSLIKALETVKNEYGELARMIGRGRLWELREVYLPASTPTLVASSRSAIGAALRISVVAEAFGGSGGIGYRMWMFYEIHRYEGFLAWSFLLIVLMLFLDKIVLQSLEEWSRRWMA